jgi:hypothetical protein
LSSDGDCTFPSLPYCSSSFSLAARRRRRCRGRPSSLLGGGTVPLLPPPVTGKRASSTALLSQRPREPTVGRMQMRLQQHCWTSSSFAVLD